MIMKNLQTRQQLLQQQQQNQSSSSSIEQIQNQLINQSQKANNEITSSNLSLNLESTSSGIASGGTVDVNSSDASTVTLVAKNADNVATGAAALSAANGNGKIQRSSSSSILEKRYL